MAVGGCVTPDADQRVLPGWRPSRPLRVLAGLLGAMSLTTAALWALEPPVRAEPAFVLSPKSRQQTHLTDLLTQTNIPIQAQVWRRAVVVAVEREPAGTRPFCHFVIAADGGVEPTDAWLNQVRASIGDDRVHILISADWLQSYPFRPQNEAVVTLLRLVYQLGQPADWTVELDSRHAPAASARMDWVGKVAQNVLPPLPG